MDMGHSHENTLLEVIDRILDKGLVINADITVSLVGVELLGIKLRAALASFETAAKFGLAFPSGTNLNAPAWQIIKENNEESAYPEPEKKIVFVVENKNKKIKRSDNENKSKIFIHSPNRSLSNESNN